MAGCLGKDAVDYAVGELPVLGDKAEGEAGEPQSPDWQILHPIASPPPGAGATGDQADETQVQSDKDAQESLAEEELGPDGEGEESLAVDETQTGTEDSGLSEGSSGPSEGSEASEGSELESLLSAYMFRLPRSYVHEGYIWPGLLMSEERHGELETLELGEGDVLICSYPKSGTTWISEIVSLLLADGDLDKVKAKPLHERVPWLEMDNGHVWVRAFWLWQLVAQTLGLKEAEKEEETKERRVLFTHLPLELLPPKVLSGPGKLIYVARNPKDNAVSFFHFHQMARFLGQQRQMEWDDWLALYAAGKVYCGSWFNHVQAFHKLAALTPDRLLFLKYEDMKEDLGREMGNVAAFLGINVSSTVMARARDHCDFASMKSNPMANRAGVWLFNQRTSAFMRKGVVGDWRNYFTVHQSEAFDALYRQRMAETPDLAFRFLPADQPPPLPHAQDTQDPDHAKAPYTTPPTSPPSTHA